MEINQNNKVYFYNVPLDKDYSHLTQILAELDIQRCRINSRYCLVFYSRKILTKLKKYFKHVSYYGQDEYDQSYMYKIIVE